jgi:DNA-3-methyladenine glycosylase
MLLGCEIETHFNGQITAGRIVETEAYQGTADPASHAFTGRSKRNEPMYQPGGYVYVYFSYGMHCCMNIVTGPEGNAQAVLIRALEPTQGMDVMEGRRHLTSKLNLCSGPGKLTQALGIDLSLSGSVLGDSIALNPAIEPIDRENIIAGPRIGISKARDMPWRFTIRSNPYVSKSRAQKALP